MNVSDAAQLLLHARQSGPAVPWQDILPASREEAYAIQDATLETLGPVGGWKVGAKGPLAEPLCAPLPSTRLRVSGTALTGPAWSMRGVEVELALRVGRDLPQQSQPWQPADLLPFFDAILPAIEVVETRLAGWKGSDPLAQLADLQSHGALVLGAPQPLPASGLDLRTLEAGLTFNGQAMAHTVGGNPAADLWRLLAWLAQHCAQRGQPLRAGQIVTTGSCTGMLFAPAGTYVEAQLTDVGGLELLF